MCSWVSIPGQSIQHRKRGGSLVWRKEICSDVIRPEDICVNFSSRVWNPVLFHWFVFPLLKLIHVQDSVPGDLYQVLVSVGWFLSAKPLREDTSRQTLPSISDEKCFYLESLCNAKKQTTTAADTWHSKWSCAPLQIFFQITRLTQVLEKLPILQ